jgi:hypothetical protein
MDGKARHAEQLWGIGAHQNRHTAITECFQKELPVFCVLKGCGSFFFGTAYALFHTFNPAFHHFRRHVFEFVVLFLLLQI